MLKQYRYMGLTFQFEEGKQPLGAQELKAKEQPQEQQPKQEPERKERTPKNKARTTTTKKG